jgi:hypothetical protein
MIVRAVPLPYRLAIEPLGLDFLESIRRALLFAALRTLENR